jgi:DNA replication and repair protein RecF
LFTTVPTLDDLTADVERESKRAASPVVLERLDIRDVRNIERAVVEPSPRVNVISGNNGHGKTTLLEAIYFAATSRSFRTNRLSELVRHGARVASARARFAEHGDGSTSLAREQVAAIEGRRCIVHIDGNRPKHLAEYATRSPVVAFHPDELALSHGPASLRRRLLDRVALFLDPRTAEDRVRYVHAQRARHALLRRGHLANTIELDAFEQLCAEHGAAVTRARQHAAAALSTELYAAFRQIGAPDISLEARYASGGSDDAEIAVAELAAQRARDAHRPSAGFGPHRDDLVLLLDGHRAQSVASQGQHRAITLSLKAAEAAAIAAVRGALPVLLLDDVSSELDPDRTAALLRFLGFARAQVFLTTTRPELIATPGVESGDRYDFAVHCGEVSRVS